MSTDAIPLDQLGSGKPGDDGLRRDQWGRLLVVPQSGGKPKGYTRVTTVAKTLDEGGGLAPWKATAAVVGTLRRPGLRAKWEAITSEHNGDPWYASPDSKAACKRLVEESAEAGGSTDRRDQGTALHSITAMVDQGRTPLHLTADTEADITAYVNTLIAFGITIVELTDYGRAVEVTVVLDPWEVGGSFDRLYNVPGYDLPLIGDLKTGADLNYAWHAFSVQLAAYSRANAIYRQGATAADDQRSPMPLVDQGHGLIVWLPAGAARCEMFVVDLDAGWEGFELSMTARDWRKRKMLAQPLSVWKTAPETTVAPLLAESPSLLQPTVDAPPAPTDGGTSELRAWLQQRIDTIGSYSDLSRQDLLRSWPVGMPSLASTTSHTDEQLAAIELALGGVEARHSIPFGTSAPGQSSSGHRSETPTRLSQLQAAFPGATLAPQVKE